MHVSTEVLHFGFWLYIDVSLCLYDVVYIYIHPMYNLTISGVSAHMAMSSPCQFYVPGCIHTIISIYIHIYICIDIYTYIHPCYKFYRADLFMCVWCLYLSTVFCISIRWHQTLFLRHLCQQQSLRHLCQRQSRCCLCCAVGLSTNERCPFRILCIIGGSLSMRLILFQYRQSHF